MKLIKASWIKLKKSRHGLMCTNRNYHCFPFDLSAINSSPRYLTIHLLYSPNEFWSRYISILGVEPVGVSRSCIICFKARIDFDAAEEELDTAENPISRFEYREVIEYLSKRLSVSDELDLLIFVNLLSEEAIMIADDGRYDQ
ncbi:MAG: hypothetical protein Q7K65_03605 [Candidatus Buchananbacteria bacterium]|nr:hypothetical protein [Candidatus Buchananbacteria bacterium]